MYGAGQLKIMIVGGPNRREDFHIEEGEVSLCELCLRVASRALTKCCVTFN